MPGQSRSATEERALHSSALAPWPRDTVTWCKSRRPLRAPARSVTAKVPGSTEAPPPKSLEVEPGNEASQDDVVSMDYVIAHNQWMK